MNARTDTRTDTRIDTDTEPHDPSGWTLSSATPVETLRRQGFVVLDAEQLCDNTLVRSAGLRALQARWNDLPADRYLLDGGNYRYRRHASYVLDNERMALELVPHRAHWQPVEYNALHGGIERWFEPVAPATLQDPDWRAVIQGVGALFARAASQAAPRWYVEAHQFRIDTASGIGRPTPEGAHRDGVDFVAVILVNRVDVRGGETRVFRNDSPFGVRFTLEQPWSALLLDDTHVVHETTPILPARRAGSRDTLVLTYRASGFLDRRA